MNTSPGGNVGSEDGTSLPTYVFIAIISSVGVVIALLAGIMICIFAFLCYRELRKRRDAMNKRDSDRVGLLQNRVEDDVVSDQFEAAEAVRTSSDMTPLDTSVAPEVVPSSVLPSEQKPASFVTSEPSEPKPASFVTSEPSEPKPASVLSSEPKPSILAAFGSGNRVAPSSNSPQRKKRKGGKEMVSNDEEDVVCTNIDSSDDGEKQEKTDKLNAKVDPDRNKKKLIQVKKKTISIGKSLTLSSEAIAVLTKDNIVENDYSRNPFYKEYGAVPTNSVILADQTAGEKARNRYRNVLPNPHSAVRLKDLGADGSTYINANFIKGLHGEEKAYIATQGPIFETMSDFWRMVWEHDVPVIVMLTNLIEKGRHKCVKYWPEDGKPIVYGNIEVTNSNEEKIPSCYTLSQLKLKNVETGEERDVYHFWYTAWPDFGIPKNSDPIFTLRTAVDSYRTTNTGPVIVHCSAGLGRSGTFIAIDMGVEQFGEEGIVDPLRYLYSMRKDRGGMIQTVDQYWFVYKALADYTN